MKERWEQINLHLLKINEWMKEDEEKNWNLLKEVSRRKKINIYLDIYWKGISVREIGKWLVRKRVGEGRKRDRLKFIKKK